MGAGHRTGERGSTHLRWTARRPRLRRRRRALRPPEAPRRATPRAAGRARRRKGFPVLSSRRGASSCLFSLFFFLGSREQASLDRSRRTEDAPLASRPRYARCRVRQLRSDVAEGGAVATQRRQGVPGDGASRHRERHEYNVVVLFALRRRGCQPSYLSTQEGAGGIQPDIKCSPPPKGGCSISVQVHFLYRCT